jgi:hypothetical protein
VGRRVACNHLLPCRSFPGGSRAIRAASGKPKGRDAPCPRRVGPPANCPMALDLGTSQACVMKIPARISGTGKSRLAWCKTQCGGLKFSSCFARACKRISEPNHTREFRVTVSLRMRALANTSGALMMWSRR